jgi:hypothetical protein
MLSVEIKTMGNNCSYPLLIINNWYDLLKNTLGMKRKWMVGDLTMCATFNFFKEK